MARNSNCGSVIYCFLITLEGLKEVPSQGKNSCIARHLEEQVHIVWYCHELGQRRSSQYSVVGRFEVGYFKLDVLCPEVFSVPNVTGRVTEPIGVEEFLGTMS